MSDNGQGIAPDDTQRVFQRDYSMRRERAGGLGLYWCAKSVAAYGGSIFAEALPDGAKFTLRLPLMPYSAASAPQ